MTALAEPCVIRINLHRGGLYSWTQLGRRWMRLGMGRFVLLLIFTSPLCAGIPAATPEPAPALEPSQTILEANRYLVGKGWQPAPKQSPSPEERRWSAVPLSSLSTCSGTGVGFCRFDYEKNQQRLSVITVPSHPGQPSVGQVSRWW